MTLPALIAAHPQAALAIGSILAKLGQGYFAGRDLESAQREQDRRVGYSNLINTFGGRSTPSPVQPSPGTATTILGGLGTALGAGADIYGSLRADKLADLQMENVQGQIAQRNLATDVARGTTLGQGAGLISGVGQSVKDWRPSFTPPPQAPAGRAPGAALRGGLDVGKAPTFNVPPPLSSTQVSPPTDLSDVGQAAFRTAQRSRRAAQGEAQREITQQQYENLLSGRELLFDERQLELKMQEFRYKLNQAGQLDPAQKIAAEKGLRGDFMKLTTDFKKIGDSFQTILAGADDPTAASDLSLIFAFMKMLDPTSTVREGEFQTAEQSGKISDTITNRIARLWDGERLKVTRGDFLKQAMEVYQSKLPGYEKISEEFGAIATRSKLDPLNVILDFTIDTDKAQQLIKDFTGKADLGMGHDLPEIDLKYLRNYQPGRLSPGLGVLRREPY